MLVVGKRPLRPLRVDGEPVGDVFVAQCVPGLLYAWANTSEEAVERLKATLNKQMDSVGPEKWYQQKVKELETGTGRKPTGPLLAAFLKSNSFAPHTGNQGPQFDVVEQEENNCTNMTA